MMPVPVHSRSYVEISRRKIVNNYRSVCAAVGPDVEVMGVVKADAYGHGAVEISRVLTGAGAKWLAVSSVEEGVTLRRAGMDPRILVMAGVMPFERDALVEYRLTPVLHALDDLAAIDVLAQSTGAPFPFHLKIDSGMARLGTTSSVEKILEALRNLRYARLEGLMTHFASAADYLSPQTERQVAYFESVCSRLSAGGMTAQYLHLSILVAYGSRPKKF